MLNSTKKRGIPETLKPQRSVPQALAVPKTKDHAPQRSVSQATSHNPIT